MARPRPPRGWAPLDLSKRDCKVTVTPWNYLAMWVLSPYLAMWNELAMLSGRLFVSASISVPRLSKLLAASLAAQFFQSGCTKDRSASHANESCVIVLSLEHVLMHLTWWSHCSSQLDQPHALNHLGTKGEKMAYSTAETIYPSIRRVQKYFLYVSSLSRSVYLSYFLSSISTCKS